MSFGNLPTNLYELLGEEGEPVKKAPTTTKSNTVAPQPTQSRPPKTGQDLKGKPTGNRGPSKSGSDPVDPDKRARPTKRHDRKPPKNIDERPDRKSGTGRGKEVSKGGHGKSGWGVPLDENAQVQETAPVVQEEKEPEETEEQRKEREEREAERERKREEDRIKEEKQITLDEYLAKKKAVGLSLPQARQPGEGVDDKAKKDWAALPVAKETAKTVVPEAKAEFGVSKSDAVISESQKKLAVLTELGFNVRVKDDARARRARQRYEEEQRQLKEREEGKKEAQPANPNANSNLISEDPRVKKGQGKKGRNFNATTKSEESFPALSAVKSS